MIEQIVQYLQTHDILFRVFIGILFLAVLVILFFLARKYEKSHVSNSKKIKKMAMIAVLATLSIVLYVVPYLRFPISPPFPSFLDFHFSNVPILIGGFLFGPVSGSLIVVVRFLAKLPSTTSFGIGEIMDVIIGLSTVLISSIIYHHHKTKKSAVVGMASSILVWTLVATLINWLFIVSFYIELYFGGDVSSFVGVISVIPGVTVTVDNYMVPYLLLAIIPFNLILSTLVSIITFFLYKRISHLYDYDFSHHDKKGNHVNSEM